MIDRVLVRAPEAAVLGWAIGLQGASPNEASADGLSSRVRVQRDSLLIDPSGENRFRFSEMRPDFAAIHAAVCNRLVARMLGS